MRSSIGPSDLQLKPVLAIQGSSLKPSRVFYSISLREQVWHAFNYHSRLANLLVQLENSSTQPPNLTQAANIACMEKTAFCKFFRSATGMGYAAFVNALRIDRAVFMLRSCDLSVTEIAESVGYGNISVFERNFKALVGVTPRAYRRGFIPGNAA